MTFTMLAVIVLAGLVGPLLAYPEGWHVPVVVGELFVGILLGRTGLGYLNAADPTFSFLAEVGFGLVMFVAGTHVPVRDPSLQGSLGRGTARAAMVGAGSAVLGVVLAWTFGTGHAALYAVLMASSSAALILPIIDSLQLHGDQILQLLPQVAIADAVCIIALPLAIDSAHQRLFSVCDGKVMAVTDAVNGKQVALVPIGEHPDAAGYDQKRGIVYSSNGEGTLSIVHQDAADRYSVLQTLPTQRGARTMALDEATGKVYLATADFGPAPAASAEQPRPRPALIPDSFVVLVVGGR